MPAILRSTFVLAIAVGATSVSRVFAQSPELTAAFADLQQQHAAGVSGGQTEAELAGLAADWVQEHDWNELALADRAWLHAKLLTADMLNRAAFSVRWTGTVAAPVDGEYVFTQYHLPGAYGGALKLWVDGALVLDTTKARDRLGVGPELAPAAEGAFKSAPVQLNADKPAIVQADYVYHDEFPTFVDRSHRWRFPLPLLLWNRQGQEPQIVPPGAYHPPADFDPEGVQGLRADYFSDVEFSNSVGSFHEPGIQFAWNLRPVLPRYKETQEELQASLRDAIMQPPQLDENERLSYLNSVAQVLPGLDALDRAAAIENISDDAQLLSKLDVKTFASWMPHVAVLPQEVDAQLLTNWSEFFEVPPARIAIARGYGPGSYAAANYRYYREAGLWMNGPMWPVAERLISEHLEREDRSCNLLVAYIVGFSSRYEHRPGNLITAIKERLDDESSSADVRVSWLLARAYASELFVGGLPQPRGAMPSLEEAMLLAEGVNLRFHVLQEIVAHLASTGQTERALEFLDAEASSFTDALQQATLAALRVQVSEFQQTLADDRETLQTRQAERAKAARLAILSRRRDAARQRGLEEVAAHYDELLEAEQADAE